MTTAAEPATRTAPAVRLHRDGVTWLLYAQYTMFGYFLYAFTPSVTLLRDDERVSDAIAGLHGTCYAAGVIAIGLSAPTILRRTARDVALWASLGVLCVGIVAYVSVPSIAVTLPAALLLGASGSGVTIVAAARLADHQGAAGPAALTEANGLAAGAGVIAPLAVGGAVAIGIGWRAALLVTVALVGAAFLLRRRFTGSAPPPPAGPSVPVGPNAVPVGPNAVPVAVPAQARPVDALSPEAPGAPVPPARRAVVTVRSLGVQYALSWAIVVFCVGIEFCMTLWSAQLLRDRAGLSPATAATGVTALLFGMSAGRFISARLATRHGVDWTLIRAFAVTAIGFAVFWSSRDGVLSFAGLAICGLGMAAQYPLGLGRAIRAAGTGNGDDGGDRSNVASARVSIGTGVAVGVAPFLLGFVADLVGIHLAFLLVPALLVAAAGALIAARAMPGGERHRAVGWTGQLLRRLNRPG